MEESTPPTHTNSTETHKYDRIYVAGHGTLDRIGDRAYLVAVLAVALWGGNWLASRGPSKVDEAIAKSDHVSQLVDQNAKAVNDYAGQVNGRLGALEKATGIAPIQAPAKK